ncbi:MAG: hypothetical protein ACPHQ9_15940, partial [Marinobacter sp.]|uniref:hypothetical protein n=1 Tax=Marinobacter sp. TaxID=50741 RepID=UPI003C62E94E
SALDALSRDGYSGPAPVLLADYEALVRRQSVSRCVVTEESIHRLFHDTVVDEHLLARLGPAVHSGRAILSTDRQAAAKVIFPANWCGC